MKSKPSSVLARDKSIEIAQSRFANLINRKRLWNSRAMATCRHYFLKSQLHRARRLGILFTDSDWSVFETKLNSECNLCNYLWPRCLRPRLSIRWVPAFLVFPVVQVVLSTPKILQLKFISKSQSDQNNLVEFKPVIPAFPSSPFPPCLPISPTGPFSPGA